MLDHSVFDSVCRHMAALMTGASLALACACGQTPDVVATAPEVETADVSVTDEVNAFKVVASAGDDVEEVVAGSVSNVNAGAIKDPQEFVIGLNVQGQGTGSATARVAGGVSVSSTAPDVRAKAVGVFMREADQDQGTHMRAAVSGDVTVESVGPAIGISAVGFNEGTDFAASVGGRVVATSEGVAPSGVFDAVGVSCQVAEGGSGTIDVGGDVLVSDEHEDTGVYGITTYGDRDSSTSVSVAGDIEATGGGEVVGALLSSREGKVSLNVEGDVRARSAVRDGYGAVLEARSGATVELVVTGTVEGDAGGLMFQGDGTGTYDVSVYEVTCAEGTDPFVLSDFSEEILDNVTSSLNYLIRLRQPDAGGSVRLVDADRAELGKRSGLPVARAGDKVYVEVDLEEGYRVSGVFRGEDATTELASDEGGPFIIVPAGGGVTVSVSLEKTA